MREEAMGRIQDDLIAFDLENKTVMKVEDTPHFHLVSLWKRFIAHDLVECMLDSQQSEWLTMSQSCTVR